MNRPDIFAKLTEVFHDVFENDDIVLSDATKADDIEGWDSLANVRLMVTVEQAFRTKFSAAEISNLKNVGEMVSLIEQKV